jgi:serine phosphatase RsbU (regulator of sigma subunit)/PAS domain-containing protein
VFDAPLLRETINEQDPASRDRLGPVVAQSRLGGAPVGDGDTEARASALDRQTRAGTRVQDCVRDELGHEELDVVDDLAVEPPCDADITREVARASRRGAFRRQLYRRHRGIVPSKRAVQSDSCRSAHGYCAQMLPGPLRAGSRSRWWVVAGLSVIGLVVVADVVTDDTVLIGALIIGPFVAAFGARTREVAALGVVAVVCAIALGTVDDVFGERDHVVRTLIVLAGCVGAALLTRVREQREAELARTIPVALDAQRLALALDAGSMGTWRWDLRTGYVEWDERLEALYGLAPGTFDGEFDTYASLIHPHDRAHTLEAMRTGMEQGRSWQFDHRVVWPDGTVHWLEGRGEPVRIPTGEVVGATGVSLDIDARYRLQTERAELLDSERDARQLAERSTEALERLGELTLALSAAATVDEVAVTIVHHGLRALDGDYGWFGSLDTANGVVLTRAHEGYPSGMIEPYLAIALEEQLPATEVLRTGDPIYVESHADRAERYPQFRDMEVHGAFVVIPIAPFEDSPGVLSFGFLEPRRFDEDERRYIAAVVEACTQALRRASLVEAELRSRARLRTLLDFSEHLAALDDPDAVLATTARFAATRIGRFAIVHATEADGTLRRAAVTHADPALQPVIQALVERGVEARETITKVAETGLGTVFSSLTELLLPPEEAQTADATVTEMLERLRPASGIVVPMRISGRTRGVVLIGDDRPSPLGHAELELASDLGRRAASAVERAQLWQMSQLQLAAEHHMVEVLQESIVPERLPDVPGVELAAVYRPADVIVDVGGDWYDAFAVHDCPLVLVVGDVAGHGIEAASLMGRVRNGFRAYAVEGSDPSVLLRRVHEMLCTLDPDSMVTAVVACYQPETGVLTWSRAGHPPALVCDAEGNTRFLEDVNATPLGTLGKNFATAQTTLPSGSLLVLYSDGLIERRDRPIDDGLEWLAERTRALRAESVETICQTLVERSFDTSPTADDICVLVLRVSSPAP